MSERQEQQASLAFDPGTPGVAGEAHAIARTWDRSLTHCMRVLLHTAPLHDLRQGDNLRDPELRHYDSLALAIKILDLIIDHTGLDRELDRGIVQRALTPLLSATSHGSRPARSPTGRARSTTSPAIVTDEGVDRPIVDQWRPGDQRAQLEADVEAERVGRNS